jgi:hypothetical protein
VNDVSAPAASAKSRPDLKLHVESVRHQRGGAESSAPRLQEDATANTGVAPNAAAQHQRPSSCPMVGTWATRPTAGSEDHHQASIGDAVVEFELTDDIVTLTQIAVDPAGRELAMKMAIHVDGQDHPVQFGSELVLRARWTGVRTLETIVKHGENIVSKGTYEVSADGQTLVVSTTEQRVVFKRV